MFANVFVGTSISQPDSKKTNYSIATGNVFVLPSAPSLFSLDVILVIGELEIDDNTTCGVEMLNSKDEVIGSTKATLPKELNGVKSATVTFGIDNMEIPEFGYYKIVAKINNEKVDDFTLKFVEETNK